MIIDTNKLTLVDSSVQTFKHGRGIVLKLVGRPVSRGRINLFNGEHITVKEPDIDLTITVMERNE